MRKYEKFIYMYVLMLCLRLIEIDHFVSYCVRLENIPHGKSTKLFYI